MSALQLPRLSMSAPVVGNDGRAAIGFVNWWTVICNAIEGAINTLQTQEATLNAQQLAIDQVLGIANGAATAADASVSFLGGISSLTPHSVLIGEGSSPITGAAPGVSGTILASNGATSDPTFKTVSAVLDVAFSSTQGTVLFRSAAGWVALAPGAAGTKLTSGGAGADLSWT